MFAFFRSFHLRETLGNEGLVELDAALDEVGQHWKEDVLEIAANRFERRLGVELSQFRVEMARELATVRVEISASRLSTIRWVAGLLRGRTTLSPWSVTRASASRSVTSSDNARGRLERTRTASTWRCIVVTRSPRRW